MRSLIFGAASLLTVAALAPSALAAEPPEGDVVMETKASAETPGPEAPVYPPPSARWWAMTAGLGTSAFFYGGALAISYGYPNVLGAPEMRVPVVGPWLSIANEGCRANDGDCSNLLVAGRVALKVIDGLAQAGGILVMLEGAFMPTQYTPDLPPSTKKPKKPSDTPSTDPPKDKPSEKNLFFLPTPMNVGERGIGIGVVGRF